MPSLRISVHEVETENGQFLCMSAGEFTGVFAPLPANEEEKRELMDSMKLQVQDRADYYLNLPDDAELSEEHDITLAEIKESIWANVVRHEPEIEHKTYGEAAEADSEAELQELIIGEASAEEDQERIAVVRMEWKDDCGNACQGSVRVVVKDLAGAEQEAKAVVLNAHMAFDVRVQAVRWVA